MAKFTKKKKIVIIAAALTLSGTAAFAYWTSSGTGTGTAATGTSAAVNAVQTSVVTDMGPGTAAQTLSGTFTNTDTQPLYVTSLAVSIASVESAPGVPAVGCEADDYVITGSPLSIGYQALVNDTTTWGTGNEVQIAFVNEAAENQDGCKNATVNLAYVVS